ncbi:hypothetical protein FBY26_2628 [Phycicoccus sp. SLBN-51]|jgi:hypothetical protein|nr:hypothetical protein FBY26_2628 [Phycicoccus sp. SLBN-51]
MVLDVLASFEAAMIGARVKAGNVEKIRQGRALAGPVPAFGMGSPGLVAGSRP